ncbi:hypothetical protein [Actinomycetospora straminea]|uniref:Uncharacterized protein n=1 Tax=Actinomycetospora straminea TaxID=663607 RepID=A0ABP9EWR5_9PSEU|nr:hypothetical protein [Actinomycetospora straminea]MDD7931771.1 hypothetical protein [Actinomycetospora straminea]
MRSTVLRVLLTALLVALPVALPGCTTAPPPRDGPPTPAQVDRALRFAALAPLPGDAVVTRLDTESGIDTRVVLAVRLAEAAPWRAASGLPADDAQQRVANPDGAVVYRSAVDGPGEVTVTAFTT